MTTRLITLTVVLTVSIITIKQMYVILTLISTRYYDINNFNVNYRNNNKLSLFLVNIRSLSDHSREMVTYLDCLNTKFKIIAVTETCLKDHHTNYTLPNYNFEQTLDIGL